MNSARAGKIVCRFEHTIDFHHEKPRSLSLIITGCELFKVQKEQTKVPTAAATGEANTHVILATVHILHHIPHALKICCAKF